MATTHRPFEIRLCTGLYKPSCSDLPVVEVICQTVILNSTAYVWIDGVDPVNPLLLPVESLHNFKSVGTLRHYLEDERHLALDENFDQLIDLCMQQNNSATVLVRACEIMHAEGVSASEAIAITYQWGSLLNTLDQAERIAYQLVAEGNHSPAS